MCVAVSARATVDHTHNPEQGPVAGARGLIQVTSIIAARFQESSGGENWVPGLSLSEVAIDYLHWSSHMHDELDSFILYCQIYKWTLPNNENNEVDLIGVNDS